MGRNQTRTAALLAIFCLPFFSLVSGCCLIGATVGGIVDAASPKWEEVEKQKSYCIEPGRSVVIQLKDGSFVHGDFQGRVGITSDGFRWSYENRDMKADGIAPRANVVGVETTGGLKLVKVDDIKKMSVMRKRRRRAATIGFNIGMIFDIVGLTTIYGLSNINSHRGMKKCCHTLVLK